jgi:triacylglycerol esterase/lipase EstA (alpha/beta hydrolase family)
MVLSASVLRKRSPPRRALGGQVAGHGRHGENESRGFSFSRRPAVAFPEHWRRAGFASGDLPQAGGAGEYPVMTTLILDGIWGTHGRWAMLSRRIESSVGPCSIWRYENSGRTSLRVEGMRLRNALEAISGPINLVGYSMGGLVIRSALREASHLNVRRVAFLHSPHNGSLAACALPFAACREMRPGSSFLAELDAAPWEIPTLATWCPFDAVVVPGASACWRRAGVQIQSLVPAHAWPVVSPEIHRAVSEFFAA